MSRLSLDSVIPRLLDLSHGTDPALLDIEHRAAALLRRVAEPAPLGPAALCRIEGRLQSASSAKAPWAFRLSLPLCAAAAGVFLLLAGVVYLRGGAREIAQVAAPSVPSPRQEHLHAAAGEQVRHALPGADLVLLGPGDATLTEGSGDAVILREGRLMVRASGRPVTIGLPDGGQVTVPAPGQTEIEVRDFHTVRVAAFAGSTTLSLSSVITTVTAGTSWTGVPETAPVPIQQTAPAAPHHAAKGTHVHATEAAQQAPPVEPAAEVVPENVKAPPAAEAPPESALAEESRMLGAAVRKLQKEHDAEGALASLEAYRARFPGGTLLPEAAAARIDALLLLGRRRQALVELDGMALERKGSAELLVLRGELRAGAGRNADALRDFTTVLGDRPADAIAERALYGSASARVRGGDSTGARADLQRYLQRFPNGRFSDAARETLGK